jgi:hypothetical protein
MDALIAWVKTGRALTGVPIKSLREFELMAKKLISEVRRIDDYTLAIDGNEYTVSGSRMANGQVNYHDLSVAMERDGRTIKIDDYPIKQQLLDFLNREAVDRVG